MDLLLLPTLILLLFLSAVFSGSEIGLYSISRVKLRYRLKQADRRAWLMEHLLRHKAPCIITILIGNNIVAQLLASLSEQALHEQVGEPGSIIITVLVLTPLVLLFGEFMPKHLFRRRADSWMYAIVYVLAGLRWLLVLPVAIIQAVVRLLEFMLPGEQGEIWEPHTSRPNLRTFFKAEGSGHNLTGVQKDLLDRILAMERITLAYEGVTKPLGSIQALDGAATVAAARANLGPKYFQRYLINDHRTGRPMGYITALDLVMAEDATTLAELVRDLPELPATTPLHRALQLMHRTGTDLLVVKDLGEGEEGICFRGDCLRVLAKMD